MKTRQRTAGRMKAKTIYLLSGKVLCANPECNHTYVGESYTSQGNFYAYYKCAGKCGNKNVKKELLEDLVINKLIANCFTPEAMKRISIKVRALYAEVRSSVKNDIEPLKKEIKTLETKIDQWLDIIGEGAFDKTTILNKINDAAEKKLFLESQLEQVKAIKATEDISEKIIIDILEIKKNLLFSDQAENKKQVLQEYIDSVCVSHFNKDLEVKLNVRVFNGGGEGICTPVSKSYHKSVYACVLYFRFRQS